MSLDPSLHELVLLLAAASVDSYIEEQKEAAEKKKCDERTENSLNASIVEFKELRLSR